MGYVKRPTLTEKTEKKANEEKKRIFGSGEQAIEIPNSEREKSERMKRLRRKQQISAEEATEEGKEEKGLSEGEY